MSLPHFTAGARVVVSTLGRLTAPGGIYTIVRALPQEGNQTGRYQIKSDTEKFERIIEAYRLSEAPLA